jgi:hypothetical protein
VNRPRALLRLASLLGTIALSRSCALAQDPAAVWVTTDPARVAGCASLGKRSLPERNGLDALRGEAARRGANVLRLTELSERGITAELYRCGAPAPEPTATPTRVAATPTFAPATPSPTATSTPLPTPASASRRSSRKTPVPPSTAERQRAAQEELETLKAAVVLVSSPAEVEGCEKRGEAKGPGTSEASLREAAVGAVANVVLVRRSEDGSISGEYYRCPRVQHQRLLAVTPPAR